MIASKRWLMASLASRPSLRLRALVRALPMLCVMSSAKAQTAADSTAAQALFEQGRELLANGRAAEACPKFEESQRLDPGSGTLINLGRCYEEVGRIASAWNKYLEAAAAANATGNTPREQEARGRAEILRPRLSNLVIEVSPDGRNVSGLEVLRDGNRVGAPQWGVPIPADEGEHTVVARAPGYTEWTRVVVLEGEGTSVAVEVPALDPAQRSTSAIEPEASPSTGLGTQRVLALIAGGVGIVGVGAGTVFGLSSKAKHDEAERYCVGRNCTDARGEKAGEAAYRAGTLSTVFMAIGGAALAGGAVLWFTAPKREEAPAAAALGIGPSGVQLRGTF